MVKRKYGSRYDWQRVTSRAYTELYIEKELFKSYVSLLHLKEIKEPLYMSYEGQTVCIADNGYYWMQHFPEGQQFSVTTVFDSSGSIVQWYLDICKEIGYCTKNGPWMDDLYLDLIVLPTGEIIEKDIDQLEVALKNNEITVSEYEAAWSEFKRLKISLKEGGELKELTVPHFELLIQTLNDKKRSS